MFDESCEKCGSKNIVWFINSVLWNKYSNGHDIICVNCFVKLAEGKGYLPTAWELVPENPPKSELVESVDSAEETQPKGAHNTERPELLYHINCEVCGKAIWRKDGFDTRCDEHPWEE